MTEIPVIHHFAALAASAEVLIVDVWGVLHDGRAGHAAAGDALARFRAAGGFVLLVSNAPRPSDVIVPMLDRLGVPRAAYDGIVSSGDITRALIAADPAVPVHHLGPERDAPLFQGLTVRLVAPEAAGRIVCTGLLDDDTETAEDYRADLEAWRARDLELVCANPDLVVERGARIVPCAGAIAALYERLGGRVVWAGKPYRPIYQAALDFAAFARGRAVDKASVMAIGDALRTDIAGGRGIGVRTLLVADGIHKSELLDAAGGIDLGGLARLVAREGPRPDQVTPRLAW